MIHTHKMYIIKTVTGHMHRVQRGYSSQDVGAALYKTVGGAERTAKKIEGGVFTIYLQTTNPVKPSRSHCAIDEQIEKAARALGFRI